MKTYIIIALLFFGLSVYAQEPLPVEPFSGSWPSQSTTPNKAPGDNPFDNIEDNPDPNPVPLGDSLGWMLILGAGYVGFKYWRSAKIRSKHHHH